MISRNSQPNERVRDRRESSLGCFTRLPIPPTKLLFKSDILQIYDTCTVQFVVGVFAQKLAQVTFLREFAHKRDHIMKSHSNRLEPRNELPRLAPAFRPWHLISNDCAPN